MHAGTNNRLSIHLTDLSTRWPAGRHRCVITWDQCPPQACITTKGAPETKVTPHFSLRLVPYSKQSAAAGSPMQECKSIAFHRKVPRCVNKSMMMILQRSHPCCTFALFCLLKTTARLSSCKDWTNHACSPAFTELLTLSLAQKRASLLR